MFDSVFKDCEKCNGNGKIDAYYYIDNGRCFKCGGSGKIHKQTGAPAQELTTYQLKLIAIAKNELATLGYFNMSPDLMEIDIVQLMDVLNQHRAMLENQAKPDQGFINEADWFVSLGLDVFTVATKEN